MKGYLTKTHDKWTLTIKDSDDIPHRFQIRNFKKFCKDVLHSKSKVVRKERSIGQYIVDKIGLTDNELWMLHEMRYEFPS